MLFKCFMLCLAKCYCWLNYRSLFILSALPLSERVSIQISQNLYLTFLWNHPLVVFQKKTLKFLQIKMPTRQKDSTASSFFGHRLLCAFIFSLFCCHWNCCYDIFMKNFKFMIEIGQHTSISLMPLLLLLSSSFVTQMCAEIKWICNFLTFPLRELCYLTFRRILHRELKKREEALWVEFNFLSLTKYSNTFFVCH